MSLLNVDTINESTAAAGVTVEGVLIKDSVLKITGGSPGADKVLTSDASGNATWADAGGGGGFLGRVVYTADATYTAGTSGHADVTKVVIEVQAGGGGGGAAASGSTNTGNGGAGGAYASKGPITVTSGQTATIVVGSKGDKGAYGSGSAGTAGGTSSAAPGTISFTTITCTGGGGGGASGAAGGQGGTVTSASATYDIRIDGQNAAGVHSKNGGSSVFGFAGELYGGGNGPDATGYGAGGSGGYGEATGGGDGTAGIVIITEYA